MLIIFYKIADKKKEGEKLLNHLKSKTYLQGPNEIHQVSKRDYMTVMLEGINGMTQRHIYSV